MIIDPFGEILAAAPAPDSGADDSGGETILTADIDPARVAAVRNRVSVPARPPLNHLNG